jgi:CheY-like chemotaxis protein
VAKILVAEDEHHIRLLVSRVLQKHGHIVKEAEDGLEALSVVKEDRVDLVLTDLNMPRMTGVELIKEICKDETHPPIVIITAYEEYVPEACRHGATYYLPKPFTQQQLVEVVNTAITAQ